MTADNEIRRQHLTPGRRNDNMVESKMFVLAVFSLLIPAASSVNCTAGWKRFHDSCYLFAYSERLTWQSALQYCISHGGHLVEVESARENDYLRKELSTFKVVDDTQIWTAGTDIHTEGEWRWENSGDRFEVAFWHPGEPNQNGGNEDCLAFFPILDLDWNDEHCDRQFPFICEKEDPADSGVVVG